MWCRKAVEFLPLSAVKRRQCPLSWFSSFSVTRRVEPEDVHKFCSLVGDSNPIHSAGSTGVVPGMLVMSLVSGVVGTNLPGSILVEKSGEFRSPLLVGQSVRVEVALNEGKLRKLCNLSYECRCVETGRTVLAGRIKMKLRLDAND